MISLFGILKRKRPKLMLHAGTHRTGTTSIQTALALSRNWLRERHKIVYPDSSAFFKGTKSHHGFSRTAAYGSDEDCAKAALFIDQTLATLRRGEKVLLSAEPIYGLVKGRKDADRFNGPDYDDIRSTYLAGLAAQLSSFDVTVILCFREREAFARSLYNRTLTTGSWDEVRGFEAFKDAHAPWLDYARQLAHIERHFGAVKTYRYEDAVSGGLVPFFFDSIGAKCPPEVVQTWENRSVIPALSEPQHLGLHAGTP